MTQDRVFLPKEAADYLGISVWALSRLRQGGAGPTFCQKSRKLIHYTKANLDAWVNARTRVKRERNTRYSDLPELAEA